MGVSSDGILCFGHDLGEEVVGVVPWATEDDDDIDFEEWLYRIAGFTARHERRGPGTSAARKKGAQFA